MSKAHPKFQLRMQIKQLNADGTFEGLLAVYNNVDLGGDVIVPGAFTKTLMEHGNRVPMLWQHKQDEPIGELLLNDTATALECKGKLLLDLPMAQKAYLLMKSQIVRGLSIGYDTIKDTVDNGVRYLKELRLWEGSVVTFPMNEAAVIMAVKTLRDETKDDFATELANQQVQDAGYQIFQALYTSLMSLLWAAELTKQEMLDAAQTTLDQFKETFMAYVPQFYDYVNEEFGMNETMSRRRMQHKALVCKIRNLIKEGRTLSAATTEKLSSAHDHVKQIMGHAEQCKSIFQTLLPDEAELENVDDSIDDGDDTGDDTETPPKAKPTPSVKAATESSEPTDYHSEISTVDSILDLLRKKRAS